MERGIRYMAACVGVMSLTLLVVAGVSMASENVEPATVIEGSEELPNDGVIKVPAGDQGHYMWDSRTDLCFFIPRSHDYHGAKEIAYTAVQVPCEPVVKITRNQ